jgi:copper resistance protein B
MRALWIASAALLSLPLYAQDHAGHQPDAAAVTPPAAQTQPEMPMPMNDGAERNALMQEHGGARTGLILGERFEYLPELDSLRWEGQGWYGSDLNKLWLKTEGEYDTETDDLERGEAQLLYSRAVAPYWDLQAGLRVDDGEGPRRHYAALGLMGLAPYWFELDLAAFLSERGDLSARLEAEYELRFTQRLILQPRLELDYDFADDPAAGIGQGVSEASLGLRLRYEWRREFAPYIGVERHEVHGGTAALFDAAGRDTQETSWVVGLRFWY